MSKTLEEVRAELLAKNPKFLEQQKDPDYFMKKRRKSIQDKIRRIMLKDPKITRAKAIKEALEWDYWVYYTDSEEDRMGGPYGGL